MDFSNSPSPGQVQEKVIHDISVALEMAVDLSKLYGQPKNAAYQAREIIRKGEADNRDFFQVFTSVAESWLPSYFTYTAGTVELADLISNRMQHSAAFKKLVSRLSIGWDKVAVIFKVKYRSDHWIMHNIPVHPTKLRISLPAKRDDLNAITIYKLEDFMEEIRGKGGNKNG